MDKQSESSCKAEPQVRKFKTQFFSVGFAKEVIDFWETYFGSPKVAEAERGAYLESVLSSIEALEKKYPGKIHFTRFIGRGWWDHLCINGKTFTRKYSSKLAISGKNPHVCGVCYEDLFATKSSEGSLAVCCDDQGKILEGTIRLVHSPNGLTLDYVATSNLYLFAGASTAFSSFTQFIEVHVASVFRDIELKLESGEYESVTFPVHDVTENDTYEDVEGEIIDPRMSEHGSDELRQHSPGKNTQSPVKRVRFEDSAPDATTKA